MLIGPAMGSKAIKCLNKNIMTFSSSMFVCRLSWAPELAEGLKEQSPGTKIILISAFADEVLRNVAGNLGIPLLSKPFTTETFLDLVAKTVRQ
jgi:hypothetical protein